MAIAFVGDATGVDTNGGTFNVSLHASSAAGHVAVAAMTSYDNTADSITFTGWTRYRADGVVPTQQWIHFLYYRILDGADPVSVTMSAQYTTWYVATYSGAHATTPLVDTGTINSGVGTAVTGTGVTVTTSGSFLFASQVGYSNGLSVGFGGMTARETYDTTNGFYDESVSSGASGNRTATLGGATDWSVTMGVIAPADGAAPAAPTPQGGLAFIGGMGGGFRKPNPPRRREILSRRAPERKGRLWVFPGVELVRAA